MTIRCLQHLPIGHSSRLLCERLLYRRLTEGTGQLVLACNLVRLLLCPGNTIAEHSPCSVGVVLCVHCVDLHLTPLEPRWCSCWTRCLGCILTAVCSQCGSSPSLTRDSSLGSRLATGLQRHELLQQRLHIALNVGVELSRWR